MRSAQPPPADAPARQRILDVAIDSFGRQGFAATSVRAIAEAAGTSPALVLHHFGSKEALRHACDDQLLALVAEAKHEGMATRSGMEDLLQMAAHREDYQPLIRYLLRAFQEDSAAARSLFDRLVRETAQFMGAGVEAGTIRPTAYPRAQALLLVAYSLGPLLLSAHIGRHLGTQGYDAEAQTLTSLPALEMFTHGLFTDSAMFDAAVRELPDPEPRLHLIDHPAPAPDTAPEPGPAPAPTPEPTPESDA